MSKYKVGDKFVIYNKVCEITKVVNEVLYDLDNNQRYIADELKSYVKLPEFSQEQTKAIDEIRSFEALEDLATEIYRCASDGVFEGVSHHDLFLALAYGYSVKKEKKYTIVDKRLEKGCCTLNYDKRKNSWFYSWYANPSNHKVHFTEQELRDAGFGHEFETMAVEVEE